MGRLYASPVRVYLMLGALALAGIIAGLNLPISLFPNSTKPSITVNIGYGSLTADEFLQTYGKYLESQLRAISTKTVKVEGIESTYDTSSVHYQVKFRWGVEADAALREVQSVAHGFAGRLPQESRDTLNIWTHNRNAGFFALSFFSETRDLDSLYDTIEPVLTPKVAHVEDAQEPVLWNPSEKEIRVELIPAAVASLQIFPRDVEDAVSAALSGRAGGLVPVGPATLSVSLPRQAATLEQLSSVLIPTPAGKSVHLSEIARIDYALQSMGSRVIKTNGAPSLILFAAPKPGGNVKKMSEDLLEAVKATMPSLPKDIQYRTLVDPSEFIRSAVNNVFREVGVAAMLAVFVLFLFIGSFRNVATAAIEIPLSMVLAFILMKFAQMNVNLISLGGLALAAGMNVDASVVVMENIFRHFEMSPGPHDFQARLRIVTQAVREVMFPIIASTIASLVVFLPLTFTSDLSYAILGDLALAVVFSHGFSAVVALILVPTVRLHLMARGDIGHATSPIERWLKRIESGYGNLLSKFLEHKTWRWSTYGGVVVVLAALIALVLPRLPREIVGLPDTDWIILGASTDGNSLVRQMEMSAGEVERDLLKDFGDRIQYTFTQVNDPNAAYIMARLKNKHEMREVWKGIEARFTNTPQTRFWVAPWNPSELPIPDPPQLRIAVRGGSVRERAHVTEELNHLVQEKKIFPRVHSEPDVAMQKSVLLVPHAEQWSTLRSSGSRVSPSDLADLTRVATTGKKIGQLTIKDRSTDIVLKYPQSYVGAIEDIGAFPLGVGSKLIPLKSLAEVSVREADPPIYREDERELFLVLARENMGEERNAEKNLAKAKAAVAEWEKTRKKPPAGQNAPTVTFEEPDKDVSQAISQLEVAVGLSIVLIFLTLLFQFGTLTEPLLVLVAIPLGLVGVFVSLFVFQSTLSLNSVLGVILLNGIAVANSIILVDFIKRLVGQGLLPKEAAVEAAKKRLRPILITSLTTILGMLPIALGLGEGGRVLQPLGIAVSGGLWVSMLLTLFLVPALHVASLEWRASSTLKINLRGWLTGLNWVRRRDSQIGVLLFALAVGALTGLAAETPIAFEDAIKGIVDRSTSVGIQQSNLDSTEARNLSSKFALLPSLSAEASHTVSDASGSRTTRRGLGAVASLNLFKFGSDFSAMAAAGAENRSQSHQLADTILKAEAEAVRVVVAYVQAALEVETIKGISGIRDEALKIAKERYGRGLMAAQEVEKLSVDLDNSKARVSDAELALVAASAELQTLLGHANVATSWPWKEWLSNEKSFGAIAEADLAKRPDWLAASEKVEGARQRKDQAWGKIFPSLDASFGYGYYKNEGGSFPDSSGPEWRGALTLTVPLFDRLENLGSYRAAIESRKIAELELEKVRRTAKSELESNVKNCLVAVRTAKLRDQTLATSDKLYRDNLQRFRRGLVPANDLFVDQDRLNDSHLNAIRGWAVAHTAFSRWCQTTGRRLQACISR